MSALLRVDPPTHIKPQILTKNLDIFSPYFGQLTLFLQTEALPATTPPPRAVDPPTHKQNHTKLAHNLNVYQVYHALFLAFLPCPLVGAILFCRRPRCTSSSAALPQAGGVEQGLLPATFGIPLGF